MPLIVVSTQPSQSTRVTVEPASPSANALIDEVAATHPSPVSLHAPPRTQVVHPLDKQRSGHSSRSGVTGASVGEVVVGDSLGEVVVGGVLGEADGEKEGVVDGFDVVGDVLGAPHTPQYPHSPDLAYLGSLL